MSSLLDDPMVQTGVAPLLVALAIALALSGTRYAWLALAAGVATAVQLSVGLSFTPLSASRKVLLLVLAAPLAGAVLDTLAGRLPKAVPGALALLAGLASAWVFQTALAQQEGLQGWLTGGGVALFVAALVYLTLRLRGDGVAAGAATVGLGFGVGIAALLSASLGNMSQSVALAAAGGALMLLQLGLGRALAPGFTGTLSAGLAAALFAAATFVLAELPWYALPLLLAVPAVAGLPLFAGRPLRWRVVALGILSLLVASATILAAWLATRATAS